MLNEIKRWEGGCQEGLQRNSTKDEVTTARKDSGL